MGQFSIRCRAVPGVFCLVACRQKDYAFDKNAKSWNTRNGWKPAEKGRSAGSRGSYSVDATRRAMTQMSKDGTIDLTKVIKIRVWADSTEIEDLTDLVIGRLADVGLVLPTLARNLNNTKAGRI